MKHFSGAVRVGTLAFVSLVSLLIWSCSTPAIFPPTAKTVESCVWISIPRYFAFKNEPTLQAFVDALKKLSPDSYRIIVHRKGMPDQQLGALEDKELCCGPAATKSYTSYSAVQVTQRVVAKSANRSDESDKALQAVIASLK